MVLAAFTFLCYVVIAASASGRGSRIEGKLNVHLVCHTHDDVGWLKTVDQYYYGANNSIQDAGVQYILDTVIPCLSANPHRKFIYVEQAFFNRWWKEQNNATQTEVRNLVKNGQLEFINGGWCMHDEAATHYVAMVDQTTLGHRLILNEFGVVPKIGWQIDPFGHSSTQAALLSARVGFEGLFFARIDYQDRNQRNTDKSLEMVWRPSPSLGTRGQVFTGALEKNGYGPPRGFNWDAGSEDAPIQDDPTLEDYNVKSRVDDFVREVMDQFSVNRGNDIMLTLGSDFEYSNAYIWYKNLDKLIDYVNADGRLNIFYSTPSIYVKAKMASAVSWPLKTDDFFPYADCPNCFWTGYFTSRPALKRNVRFHSAYLNTARQLEVIAGLSGRTAPLAEAIGVAQHHDAVSGTSKQHVAYDYARRIGSGRVSSELMINSVLSDLVGGDKPKLIQCSLLNETYCGPTESFKNFVVVVYNPLGRSRQELIRLPVTGGSYTVHDSTGREIPSQTERSFVAFPKAVSPAPRILYFLARVPALGYCTYFVQASSSLKPHKSASADGVIENDILRITFSPNGGITSFINKKTGISTQFTQDFMWYSPVQNNRQNSGAYIFRPNGAIPLETCQDLPTFTTIQGPIVSELRTVCGYLAQTVRLVAGQAFAEFEYQVGSIPIDDLQGKELITRFSTNIKSASRFYTDSNGREFQERVRNFRPTWKLNVTEPIAGNYYPINAAAYIRDTTAQLSVLNDRSQGGASINDGQIEFMIHRRLLWDDARGVGEPLNETDSIKPYPHPERVGTGLHITGSHYLFLDTPDNSLSQVRDLQSRVFSSVLLAFGQLTTTVQQWIQGHTTMGSALKKELPPNVDLMTLQALENGDHLLRLSHQFGVGEDQRLSVPVTVDLTTLFSKWQMTNIQEVSLTTNQKVADMKSFDWKVEGGSKPDLFPFVPFVGYNVTVNPIDIRTFTFKLTK